MPYTHVNSKGETYYLHGKDVVLRNHRVQRIHYFARQPRPGEVLEELPPGYVITENPRTGLPILAREK